MPSDTALAASGFFGTDIFPMHYDQGMVFIEEIDAWFQSRFKDTSQLLVAFITGDQADTGKQAPRIGIDDEDGPLEGIQQNVIRGFRTDAVHFKQRFSQGSISQTGKRCFTALPLQEIA